jgi:hypothetical protein
MQETQLRVKANEGQWINIPASIVKENEQNITINSFTLKQKVDNTLTYVLVLSDGQKLELEVTNAEEDINISNITLLGTLGLVHQYTVEYNDGTTTTFTINTELPRDIHYTITDILEIDI